MSLGTANAETPDGAWDAAALYFGEVTHARLKPLGHRFSYRVMSLLIDLDRLDAADRQSPLFGVNRAALYSFREADHGERDGSSLRTYAQRCATQHDIDLTAGRVWLLCYPRLLGYTFNPLSVYFCHRADGTLALMIYEVRNTFGEIHPYVLPVRPGDISAAGLRQQQDKLFYVSPFVGMAFSGHRRTLTTSALLRAFISLPLVTLKIVAAIHWEAVRLWLKGIRLVARPDTKDANLPNTALASRERHAYISSSADR